MAEKTEPRLATVVLTRASEHPERRIASDER
jgi:hypothetical protein